MSGAPSKLQQTCATVLPVATYYYIFLHIHSEKRIILTLGIGASCSYVRQRSSPRQLQQKGYLFRFHRLPSLQIFPSNELALASDDPTHASDCGFLYAMLRSVDTLPWWYCLTSYLLHRT